MKRFSQVFVSWMLLATLLPGPTIAGTIVVDPGGGGDHREIQAAIDAAQAGDTVLVKPGEYLVAVPITYRGKGITVKSEGGPDATTIRMAEVPADPARPWTALFESGEGPEAILEGFTLTGPGTGLVSTAGSAPTVKGCAIARNLGPGVSVNEGSSLTLMDSRVFGMGTRGSGPRTELPSPWTAAASRELHPRDGDRPRTVTIRNSTIAENSKTGLYGYSGAHFDVERSTIAGNGECAFRWGRKCSSRAASSGETSEGSSRTGKASLRWPSCAASRAPKATTASATSARIPLLRLDGRKRGLRGCLQPCTRRRDPGKSLPGSTLGPRGILPRPLPRVPLHWLRGGGASMGRITGSAGARRAPRARSAWLPARIVSRGRP